MAQDLTDLGQVGACAEHLCGGGVAQTMGVHRRQSGAEAGLAYHIGHAVRRETAIWGPNTGEHVRDVTSRSPLHEPGDDGLTYIRWQRQTFVAIRLAVHHDLAVPPVDVTDLQGGHLPGPQSEADQDGEDGMVALADWGGRITTGEKAINLARIECLGQRTEAVTGHPGYGMVQRLADLAINVEKA